MQYEVYFRCLMCNGIELVESITITRIQETQAKDIETALADYYREVYQRTKVRGKPDSHSCFARTGITLDPGQPYPQMGIMVFAGLRRK